MLTERLQIPIKDGDYERYLRYAKGLRFRGLAYINALFKIRNENHIQCVIIGDVGQGKSTTATLLAKYDTIFTRELLKLLKPQEYAKYGDKIKFNLDDHVIISPLDPASKYVYAPEYYNSYEIDEGYLWATTSDANSRATQKLIKSIVENRKLHPSFYHVYQNLFKMPNRLLELMNEVLLKLYVDRAALLVPTRMVQIAEKFDKATIERYARNPKTFAHRIRYHPAFVDFIHTLDWSPSIESRYLKKYEKYKIKEEQLEEKKEDAQIHMFKALDSLINKRVADIKTKSDIAALIKRSLLESGKVKEPTAESMSTILADKYISWKTEQASQILTEHLKGLTAKKLNLNDVDDLIDRDEENGGETS